MKRELFPEEICPGDAQGSNKDREHAPFYGKGCGYCGAKRKNRKRAEAVGTICQYDATSPNWKQLDRGRRIPPGEFYNLDGLEVKNNRGYAIWLEKMEYSCEDIIPKSARASAKESGK